MKLGKTLYVTNRKQWRAWLAKNHKTASEIWLIYYRQASGRPRLPYNAAVEEALCYGWIDSQYQAIDQDSFAQRFSPRRQNSPLSVMNKERIRRLIKAKKMTRFGLERIQHELDRASAKSAQTKLKAFELPDDILDALKADPIVWRNFRRISHTGARLGRRGRPEHRPRPDDHERRRRRICPRTGMRPRCVGA